VLGIARGFAYLHTRTPPIFHGDPHPVRLFTYFVISNITPRLQGDILIDSYGRPLICDFGLSRICHEVTRTYTTIREGGRLRFLAPELLEGPTRFRTTAASDIFSLSMLYFNLWAGQVAFVHLSELRTARAILQGERPLRPADDLIGLPSETLDAFWLLIQDMWAHDARSRPATKDVLFRLEVIFAPLSNETL
jgi:serine/threonine protein kinase